MNKHFDSPVAPLSSLRHASHERPSGKINIDKADVGDNEDDNEIDV